MLLLELILIAKKGIFTNYLVEIFYFYEYSNTPNYNFSFRISEPRY